MRTLISYKNAWGIISAVALTMTFGCTPESFDEDLIDDQQIEAAASGGIAGISLPPKQGTSNNGMFSTSPLANIYTQKEVQDTVYWKKGIRISINPQTVADRTQWLNTQNMANWALQKGGYVIFGMWDSDQHDMGGDGHGDGLVDPGEHPVEKVLVELDLGIHRFVGLDADAVHRVDRFDRELARGRFGR